MTVLGGFSLGKGKHKMVLLMETSYFYASLVSFHKSLIALLTAAADS